jgi:hypothetical protein
LEVVTVFDRLYTAWLIMGIVLSVVSFCFALFVEYYWLAALFAVFAVLIDWELRQHIDEMRRKGRLK